MTHDRRRGATAPPTRAGDAEERLWRADAARSTTLTPVVDASGFMARIRLRADELPAPSAARTPTAREAAWRHRLATATKVTALVLVGAALHLLPVPPTAAVLYTYVLVPVLLVGAWAREGGAQRWTQHRRPTTRAGWAAQVDHHGRVLRADAANLRATRRRATDARRHALDLRERCAAPGDTRAAGLAERADVLIDELTVARRQLKKLAGRIDRAGEQATMFAAAAVAEPATACFDFGRLFVALDPEPVGTLMRTAALAMKVSSDVGAAIPYWAGHLVATAPGGGQQAASEHATALAHELQALLAETQRCSQATRRTARRLLDDANELHTAVAAAVVDTLDIAAPAKLVARLAVQLSPYSRSATKTTSVRTFFARLISRRPRLTVLAVCRAAATALVRGRYWNAASSHA